MVAFSKLRWSTVARPSPRETGTPAAAGPPLEPLFAEDIVSGRVGPNGVGVEFSPTSRRETPDKQPWWTLRGFWDFVTERRQRTGVKPSGRRKAPFSRTRNRLSHAVGSLSTSEASAPGPTWPSEHTNSVIGQPESVPLRDAYMMDRQAPRSANSGSSAVKSADIDTQEECFPMAQSSGGVLDAEDNHLDSKLKGGSPLLHEDKSWFYESVIFKDGKGDQLPGKLFYDTLSSDNLASRKFVEKHGVELRLILPHNLKAYGTPKGTLVPTEYIEVWLQHGTIKKFEKVQFIVVEDMDGIGMVAGRSFIEQYEIKLDPTKKRDMYPVVAGEASPEAKEAQRRLLAQAALNADRTRAFTASTVGSTTTSSRISSREQQAAWSRTSDSSRAKSKLQEG